MGWIFPSTKGGVNINGNLVFLTDKDKPTVSVGFSKKELKKHKGIAGLKYYLVVMYLRKHVEIFGEITLSINRLMEECGYSTKSHNKNSYDDFRVLIKNEILDNGYASTNSVVMEISPTAYFTIQLSTKKSIFFSNDEFVLFTMQEFEQIVNLKSRVNKSILAGVFLYIKQFISAESQTVYGSKVSFPSKIKIKKALGISSTTTIESAIAGLINAKLLYSRSDFFIEDSDCEGVFIPARNIFALSKNDLSESICVSELEGFYKTKVYTKENVPGEIKYLKEKDR